MTVKETLRLFPSVPFIGRKLLDDIELTENRVIPAGSNIIVPIYSMGHNEKYFEDPETFRPERFLVERSMEKQNAFTYIPFSAGPRNCIGQKFAMYEIKSIVSKILRNFEIVLTNESETYPVLCSELVLRSDSRISFYFKPRVY
ncbi:cytochrome P450 4d1-like [Contarinia nasturtii]|uniref:cytochrome P450 4d1-like n=1 Tax=Contarinia nasturtii TaxID=265458 RepID=UPI0012D3CCD9|nr:cytochrome P450 4d1-like [Contarinia nasturtii]XP_031637834.1 cytochrome P450 4d1-like [Contarinia nasturtii]